MHCAICKGTSQCFRCIIKELQLKVSQQEVELRYWKGESCKLLCCSKDYRTFYEISHNFLPLNYIGDSSEYRLLTITFDPKKFGLFNVRTDEQNYILKQLMKLIKAQQIKSLSGCFEYQKNGTTHAHLIVRVGCSNSDIENALRPYFTDDLKNKFAIKCEDPKNMKNVENYLQKESNEYYRYDNAASIDLDYMMYEQNTQPIKPILPTHNIIKVLEQEIINIRQRIEKYKKSLYVPAQE